MKPFKLETRRYRMLDYLRMSMEIAPIPILVIIFTGITLALVPTATAQPASILIQIFKYIRMLFA
ncbi:MAG: hypothetical protein VB111_11650 [Clostridiaceae bacterium]|nr:hypothetical protein [Clostridiaceae bacterium]